MAATQLTPGTQLGPYRIDALLGAGGMGKVYKARDTRLGREVAIKTSEERFSGRFEGEARAISALNHPHICTLYDIGPNYLVMELVEGETLSARLARGPLSINLAMRYGAQIAEALAAAHAQGVIHRDLKPSNIILTKAGIKVLDFGLAKIATSDETLTVDHAVIGTLPYMAPEQLQGASCDARSDVFSFGAVMYEMLTGQRAFESGNRAGIVPSVSSSRPDVPAALDRVVTKCLATDPHDRWQSASDLAAQLRWMGEDAQLPRATAQASRPLWKALIAVVLLLIAATAVVFWRAQRPASPVSLPMTRFNIHLPGTDQFPIDTGLPTVVGVAPRSGDVYYVARSGGSHRLYRRKRDQLEAEPVPGTEGALMPFFSPDGQWIGFASEGELKKVALAGGPPVTLCPVRDPAGASWGKDDMIVFSPAWTSELMQVPASGGTPKPLTALNTAEGETSHRDPHFLPSGQILFSVSRKDGGRIEVLSPATGERRVISQGRNAFYVPTGHLVFARGGTLFAAPFDLDKLALRGEPLPVVTGVRIDSAKTHFAVGSEGTLTYVPAASTTSTLVWVDRQGKARRAFEETRAFSHPRLAPEGTRVVAHTADGIWVYDLSLGTRTRLATTGGRPIWAPDGKHLFFSYRARGLYSVPADGGSEPQFLISPQDAGTGIFPLAWSADGRFLAFSNPTNETSRDIWVLERGGTAAPFIATPLDERAGMFSPDGRWFVYALKRTGRDEEVWVQAYPGPGGRWMISNGGGMEPVWSQDGREIFYRSLDGTRMMAANVQTSPTFSASRPRVLYEGRYELGPGGFWSNYDVSKDGREFLMLQPQHTVVPDTQLTVVLNWHEELKRRVPTR